MYYLGYFMYKNNLFVNFSVTDFKKNIQVSNFGA